MDKKYAAALAHVPVFAEAAEQIVLESSDRFSELTAQVTAPVLFSYVWNVLVQAERMGLKRLYFLSRDGYLPFEIAKEIAKVCAVSVELKYLYGSRAALRLPCVHRIDKEDGMSLLLYRGSKQTLQHILNRALITNEERKRICEEIDFPERLSEKKLSYREYHELCTLLRNSIQFREASLLHSREAYTTACGYFEQEGLTEGVPFGIVDIGWTTEIQHSLRQLLDGIPPITGFYFGLTETTGAADGVYNTWYFSPESNLRLQTRFSRSLFTSICNAPHSMTIGYQEKNGRFLPVLQSDTEKVNPIFQTQMKICRKFSAECAGKIRYGHFDKNIHREMCIWLLTALMYRPTKEEAELFGMLPCRDADSLVTEEEVLKEHLFFHRSLHYLRKEDNPSTLPWSYGSLAVSNLPMQILRRSALRHEEIMYYLLRQIHNR